MNLCSGRSGLKEQDLRTYLSGNDRLKRVNCFQSSFKKCNLTFQTVFNGDMHLCIFSEEDVEANGVLPIPDLCTFSLNEPLSSDYFTDFQTDIATDLASHCGKENVSRL